MRRPSMAAPTDGHRIVTVAKNWFHVQAAVATHSIQDAGLIDRSRNGHALAAVGDIAATEGRHAGRDSTSSSVPPFRISLLVAYQR